MNRTHTSAGLTTAGFVWLIALLTVVITKTPVRVLVGFILLAASAPILVRIRQRRRALAPGLPGFSLTIDWRRDLLRPIERFLQARANQSPGSRE